MKSFNINSSVKIKLTKDGEDRFVEYWKEILKGTDLTYDLPEIDSEGFREMQMHEIMDIYGSLVYSGKAYFEYDILINEEDLT